MSLTPARKWKWAALIALTVLALDQITKIWALSAAQAGELPQEVTGFFNLVLVWNHGISFGMFARDHELTRWFLVAMTSTITLGVLWWLRSAQDWRLVIALSLVAGGAVGNIIDRVRLGAVVDFLDFHLYGYHWPAFNLADSAICLGVAFLLWDTIVHAPATEAATGKPPEQQPTNHDQKPAESLRDTSSVTEEKP